MVGELIDFRTTIEFPEIVACIREAQKSEEAANQAQWRTGDALIKECGPPGPHGVNNGSKQKLLRIAAALQRLGFPRYNHDYLRQLRRVAAMVPDGDRSPSVPWAVYDEAGDLATFNAAKKAAALQGKELDRDFVAAFRKQQAGRSAAVTRAWANKVGIQLHPPGPELAKYELKKAAANAFRCLAPAQVAEIMRDAAHAADVWPQFVAALDQTELSEAAE